MRESIPAIVDAGKRATVPGLYLFIEKILEWPVEKWVSIATLIFVLLQIILILKNHFAPDRRKGLHPADHEGRNRENRR